MDTIAETGGYELKMENHFDEHDSENLQDIQKEHKLNMKKHDSKIVIYKPKQH